MVARRHSEHRKSSLLGVVGIAAVLLSGCGNGNGLAALRSGSAQPASQNPEYVIGGNDELSIRYVYNPSFDQTVAVQPDGRIALPMIGQVMAAGRTPKELSRELWELYDRYLQRPDVIVTVKNAGSQRVFIGGEVGRPGVVPLEPGMTISTAITAAGGFRDTAGQSKVVLLRRDPAGAERAYTIDVARILNGSDLGQNVELGPRDMVFVPRSDLASVNLFIKQLIRDNMPVGFGAGLPL